jgi:hypothetical protein
MKQNNFLFIISLIVISLIGRMLIDTFALPEDIRIGYLLLFATISAYYGVYAQRQNSGEIFDWLMDFKGGAQLGALYGLGVGITVYVYYKWINPYYLTNLVTERKNEIIEAAARNNVAPETVDLALENIQSMADLLYVPGNRAILTITSMTALSLILAAIFATITKYFPRFVNQ